MGFSVSVLGLLALAVVGVLVLGGLGLSIVLLLNEKTRVIGIVLLVIILLGVPIVGGGLAVFVWVLTPVSPGAAPIPPQPVVEFEERVEPEPLPKEPAEANPADEPKGDENGDQPGQTEPIPAADQPQPDPPDEQAVAPIAEPDANSEARRLFPRTTHRRLNT